MGCKYGPQLVLVDRFYVPAQPLARMPGASHLKRLPEYLKDPTVTATKQGGGRTGASRIAGKCSPRAVVCWLCVPSQGDHPSAGQQRGAAHSIWANRPEAPASCWPLLRELLLMAFSSTHNLLTQPR